jgi:hypothetical protein
VSTVVGLSTAWIAGIGIALAAASAIWSMVSSHQAEVKANRQAREARWEAFYETGVAVINEVYGSTQDFDEIGWSRAHSEDEGFGQYYGLGAEFYFWSGGTVKRDPNMTPEDFRVELLTTIKNYGLDPTRIMGYANVGLDEQLNPQTDFVAYPEKILTTKEVLIGAGYSADEINKITFKDPLTLFYDAVIIDLPNVKTDSESESLLYSIDLYLRSMGLDPNTFSKKTDLPSEVKVEGVSQAGMPSWGWIVIAGIALSAFLGKKSKGRK